MIWSYPATNCSSVSGVCSLKWELGHKKKKKTNKRENATHSWTKCINGHTETKNKQALCYCLSQCDNAVLRAEHALTLMGYQCAINIVTF